MGDEPHKHLIFEFVLREPSFSDRFECELGVSLTSMTDRTELAHETDCIYLFFFSLHNSSHRSLSPDLFS